MVSSFYQLYFDIFVWTFISVWKFYGSHKRLLINYHKNRNTVEWIFFKFTLHLHLIYIKSKPHVAQEIVSSFPFINQLNFDIWGHQELLYLSTQLWGYQEFLAFPLCMSCSEQDLALRDQFHLIHIHTRHIAESCSLSIWLCLWEVGLEGKLSFKIIFFMFYILFLLLTLIFPFILSWHQKRLHPNQVTSSKC